MLSDGGYFGVAVMFLGMLSVLLALVAAVRPGDRPRALALSVAGATLLMGMVGTGVGLHEFSAVPTTPGLLGRALGVAMVPTTVAAAFAVPSVLLLGLSRVRSAAGTAPQRG